MSLNLPQSAKLPKLPDEIAAYLERSGLLSDGAHAFPLTGDVVAAGRSVEEVRGDIEIVRQIQLLMDQRDAERLRLPHRVDRYRRAIDDNLAGIRRLHARENLHECAFARAVLADQSEHFTARDMQPHVGQCPNAGKSFRYAADFEKRRGV